MNQFITKDQLENLSLNDQQEIRRNWIPSRGQLVYNFLLKESGYIISRNFNDWNDIFFYVEYDKEYSTGGVWKNSSLPVLTVGQTANILLKIRS